MTKSVNVTIDIKIARRILTVAGFNHDKIKNASDDEIFAKVLSLIDCYGATSEIPSAQNTERHKKLLTKVIDLMVEADGPGAAISELLKLGFTPEELYDLGYFFAVPPNIERGE